MRYVGQPLVSTNLENLSFTLRAILPLDKIKMTHILLADKFIHFLLSPTTLSFTFNVRNRVIA